MKNINFKIRVKWIWDNKAKCWVFYSKKYDLSGYGRTKNKAILMFQNIIHDLLMRTKPKK